MTDWKVFIVKGGVVGSTNKASGTTWPTSDGTATYGGAADLWGTTWTVTDINASDFGVALEVISTDIKFFVTAQVDHVSITVYYTAGGGGGGSIPVFMNHYRQQGICG